MCYIRLTITLKLYIMKLYQVPRKLNSNSIKRGGQFGIESKVICPDKIEIEFLDGQKKTYKQKEVTELDEDFNIDFIFRTSATLLLKLIANNRVDIKSIAEKELNNRGYDKSGNWIGFSRL